MASLGRSAEDGDRYNDRMEDNLIAAYEAGPERVAQAVIGLPDDVLNRTPGPDAWSVHEIVVHLGDAEIVGADRIRRALADEDARLVAFDESTWGDRLHYATRDVALALDLFRALRRANADLLRRLSPEEWDRTGTHTERGRMTVRDIVRGYVDHVEYHIRQIEGLSAH
jgi:hypothetical protein